MQLFRISLGLALVGTVAVSVSLLPASAQQSLQSVADRPAQTTNASVNPIFGKITVIDEAAQTIKIANRKVKIADRKVKTGGKTVDALERGAEVVQSILPTPQTRFTREERGLAATEIEVGDSFSSIGVKGYTISFSPALVAPTIASVNPVKFRLKSIPPDNFLGGSDAATIIRQDDSFIVTLTKPEEVTFTRSTPLNFSDLAVGQSVLVYPATQPNGKADEKIEVGHITVLADKATSKK